MEAPLNTYPRTPWTLSDGRVIELVTPEEFAVLADGTALVSILSQEVVKGVDYIDDDTRAGFLAFGLLKAVSS